MRVRLTDTGITFGFIGQAIKCYLVLSNIYFFCIHRVVTVCILAAIIGAFYTQRNGSGFFGRRPFVYRTLTTEPEAYYDKTGVVT